MYVLDFIRESSKWEIKIPLYHRGHLSLYPGTTVHMTPIVRHTRAPHEGSSIPLFHELLGTTIQDSAWSSVFRVSLALHDGAGVVHDVLQSIALHGGNVLHLDSTSTDQELHHNLEIIVDFASLREHTKTNERRSDEDISMEIEGLLLAGCARSVVETGQPGRFRVTARPISSLRRAQEMLEGVRVRGGGPGNAVVDERVLDNGRVALPELIQETLLEGVPGVTGRVRPPFKYFITSDTKDRVFRVTFIPKEREAVWCAIRHADEPGAISEITRALKARGLTLLCALNRVQQHQGFNWFETVVSKTSASHSAKSPVAMMEDVAAALDAESLRARFKLKPYFEWQGVRTTMFEERLPNVKPRIMALRPHVALDDWLGVQERALESADQLLTETLERPDIRNADMDRMNSHRRALQSGIKLVRKSTRRREPRVFLSIEFGETYDALKPIVDGCCRDLGIRLEVVDSPSDDTHGTEVLIRNEILERMKLVTAALAVWTPSKKTTEGRPSPWCMWEMGAMAANDLRVGVLIQKGMTALDHDVVYHDRYYRRFDPAIPNDFKNKVLQVLTRLVRER